MAWYIGLSGMKANRQRMGENGKGRGVGGEGSTLGRCADGEHKRQGIEGDMEMDGGGEAL